MNYTFNCDIAKAVGVEEATMLENIYYWVAKNKANQTHCYDNNYWTYNSNRAFSELFPFWSTKQINRILKNLEEKGFLVTGNYNKVCYDRTKWYALTEKAYSIFLNGKFDFPKQANDNSLNGEMTIPETGKPIPNINTNINTNNKPNNKKESEFDLLIKEYTTNEELKTNIYEFIKMRKGIKAAITTLGLKKMLNELNRLASNDTEKIKILDNSIMNSWKGVFALKVDYKEVKQYGVNKQNNKPIIPKTITGEGEELAKRAIEKYGDKLQDFECEF